MLEVEPSFFPFDFTNLGPLLFANSFALSLSPYVTHFLPAIFWCGHLLVFSCVPTMNRSFYPCVCVTLITPH